MTPRGPFLGALLRNGGWSRLLACMVAATRHLGADTLERVDVDGHPVFTGEAMRAVGGWVEGLYFFFFEGLPASLRAAAASALSSARTPV